MKLSLARLLVIALSSAALVACSSTEGTAGETPVEETGEAASESIPVGTALHATTAVSMREGPATSDTRIRTIPNAASVKVVVAAPQNGFYHVSYDGDDGWVFGRYLTLTDAPTDPGGGNYATTRNISIVYQGSCSFLHRCDSYSRPLPAGQVNWGCLGHGAVCVDSEHWASGPSRAYCGKTVKFCKGDVCTTAVIKDVSVSHDFEGSPGVFDALGIGYGGGSTCSNTYISGNPHVTVSY